MKTYTGRRLENGDTIVEVIMFRPRRRTRSLRHVKYHSTTNMNWGYYGSGPADLALAILTDHLGERPPVKGWEAGERFNRWLTRSVAADHHQDFKRAFVVGFGDEWSITTLDINAWLMKRFLSKKWKRSENVASQFADGRKEF